MIKKKAHFIGIGGIGISALARCFLAQNWLVSGSDAAKSSEVLELRRENIKVKIGHEKSNIRLGLDLVVYSQAIPVDNPEFLEAKRLNLLLKSYPEALGELSRKYKTVAIAGSHGKSTTTALTALVFIEAGLDPTVVVGAKLKEFGGKNFRLGKSKYLIIEADEYKNSFLNYYPQGIIVTNVDREHLDHYKNFHNVKKGFLKFMANVRPGGILVLNKDDKPLASLVKKMKNKRVVWFGIKKDVKQVKQLRKVLKIPGCHNISNALGILKLAKNFGIKEETVLKAITKHKGVWRRMEYKGQCKIENSKFKIQVYDDYAHHPTEIKATLEAFKEKFPESLLICVFQPHQTYRLQILFKEFTGAFNKADALILFDIYKVSGRDELPAPNHVEVSHNMICCNGNFLCNSQKFCNAKNIVAKSLSSKDLIDAINHHLLKSKNIKLKKVLYLPRHKQNQLPKLLKEIIFNNSCQSTLSRHKSAIIVMMGAGDIYNLTSKLVR